MTSSLSDLATNLHTLFPHKTFPVFSDRPTFANVRKIQKLVEQNAGSIPTSVEGTGAFNHIYLTKTAAEWTTLTGLEAVVNPVDPPNPVIPNNATAARIAQINLEHGRLKKLYEKHRTMKELLTNLIVSAFNEHYIRALRNPVTHQINQGIPEIFRVLYRYTGVQPTAVRERESEILATAIDLDFPLVVMFDDIEDFVQLAQAAREPKTDAQIMNLALTMIKQSGTIFQNAVIAWNARPAIEKTWANMKTHFDNAHRALQDASDLPLGQSLLQNNINHLTTQVSNKLNIEVQQRLNNMQQSIETALQAAQQSEDIMSIDASQPSTSISTITDHDDSPVETPTTQLKNFFTSQINNIQQEHQKQLNELKKQLSNNSNNGGPGRNNTRRDNKRKRGGDSGTTYKEYKEGDTTRTDLRRYCWTHGACSHSSDRCRNPADGHNNQATFKTKMGGSESFCQFAKNNK